MSEIENLKIYGGATYTVGNQDIIANEWEAGKTYVKNKSYVIREHRLYVCNVTHTSVEPFDATKWTEITIGEAIAANTTAIGDLSQLTTTDKSSLVGAVNEVNDKFTIEDLYLNGTTKSYTFANNKGMAIILSNPGNNNADMTVVTFRGDSEAGITTTPTTSLVTVTASGLTITISATYATRIKVILIP